MSEKKLTFLSYNVQDFFLFLDKYQGEPIDQLNEKQWASFSISSKKNKSLEKIFGIQQVIQETNPDVVLLIEIGGKESLENFNQYFLNGDYQVYLLPTNSDRGIEIGYLVKPKYQASIHSYRKYKLENDERFARDVPELRISRNNKLIMIFLGVHLKSKLDKEKVDFEGRSKRANEVKGLKDIFLSLCRSIQKIPIILAGDFNGIIHQDGREPEFDQLFQETSLTDILDLCDVPFTQRYTHQYFTSKPQPIENQIDYILLEKKFKKYLIPELCYVYRYKNSYGDTLQTESLKEKRDLPSDHYPVVMTIRY